MFDIEYIFTPTYSPGMNPVEKAFVQLRKILIQKEFKPLVETNLEYAIYEGVSVISSSDCKNYIKDMGYMNVNVKTLCSTNVGAL